MITVAYPPSAASERAYAVDVVLRHFLGLDYRTEIAEGTSWTIRGDDGQSIVMPDVFLKAADAAWLSPATLPTKVATASVVGEPYADCALEPNLPLLFAASGPLVSTDGSETTLSVDVFGTAFFMLSRYEEANAPESDGYARYPMEASAAARFGFLHRPIVDELVEVLWWAIHRNWPSLDRKPREFRVSPTFDIDLPYGLYFANARHSIGRIGAEILKRGNWDAAMRYAVALPQVKLGNYRADPAQCFDYILGACEARGLAGHFHVITDKPAGLRDCDYDVDHPRMRDVLGAIVGRGHALGLHGSFMSSGDAAQLRRELGILERAATPLAYAPGHWQSRQHYLRWQTPESFVALDEAGIGVDTTMGFAGSPGFRCGTSHPFPAYDVRGRHALTLIERPMIAMEVSVMYRPYLALGYGEDAVEAFLKVKRACRKYGGDFVLNWHNNNLITGRQRALFEAVLDR